MDKRIIVVILILTVSYFMGKIVNEYLYLDVVSEKVGLVSAFILTCTGFGVILLGAFVFAFVVAISLHIYLKYIN